MDKMNNKNIMTYSSIIIAAMFLFVVGGQGYVKIVSGCFQGKSQDWNTGYNDGQNDYRDGKPNQPKNIPKDFLKYDSYSYLIPSINYNNHKNTVTS
jgi:hypothetical protein